jgi:hypothetical protein
MNRVQIFINFVKMVKRDIGIVNIEVDPVTETC